MKKTLIKAGGLIFPTYISSLAYKHLTNPQLMKLRDHELEMLNQSQQERILFKNFEIQTYKWGTGKKNIMMVHGWEGQAGNFSDLIQKLICEDFTVFSFDGPSHGFSSKGSTSLFEFTDLIGHLIQYFEVNHLVSHSFGGVATIYALAKLPHLKIDKYALLTTPNKFADRIDAVAEKVGISQKIKMKLVQRLTEETGLDIWNLQVSDFVKDIQVKKALIIHDVFDKVLPVEQSRQINKVWDIAELLEVEHTGHFGILRNKEVIERVVNFLK
jgi:pimeloyl-ACP methyl ester carboxylesterase